jgi:hypothetical protein
MSKTAREVRAKDIAGDIRAGMAASELMRKYRLSEAGLRSAFRKLLDAKIIGREDIIRIYVRNRPMRSLHNRRKFRRKRMNFPLVVCDAESPKMKGFVRDFSEKGIAVEGIEAITGDLRALRVPSNELVETSTFEFVAECRWARSADRSDDDPVAGFEIINISTGAFEQLKKLL